MDRKSSILALAVSAVTSAQAIAAPSFSDAYFFGASMYDTSYNEDASAGFLYLNLGLGTIGSSNYAQAGATPAQIDDQAQSYLSSNTIDIDALYVLSASPNGLNSTNILAYAQQTYDTAESLVDAGAKYVMVANNTWGSVAPTHTAYDAELQRLISDNGLQVIATNDSLFLSEIIADPTAFGLDADSASTCYDKSPGTWCFSNPNLTEHTVYGKTGSSPDENQLLNKDGAHLTQIANQMRAAYYNSVLSAPALVATLPQATINTTADVVVKTLENFDTAQTWEAGKWQTHISGTTANSEVSDSTHTEQVSSDNKNFSLGLSYQLTDDIYVGLVGSRNNIDTGNGLPIELNSDANFISILSGVKFNRLTISGGLTAGKLDYDTERNIDLIRTVRTERASTEGDYRGIHLNLQYQVPFGAFSIAPIIKALYQDINIDSFAEDSDRSTAMQFGNQEIQSFRLGGGLAADYTFNTSFGRTRIFAEYTQMQEMKDSPRDTPTASVKTLAGSSFTLPGYTPDNSYDTSKLGVIHNSGAMTTSLTFNKSDDNESFALNSSYSF